MSQGLEVRIAQIPPSRLFHKGARSKPSVKLCAYSEFLCGTMSPGLEVRIAQIPPPRLFHKGARSKPSVKLCGTTGSGLLNYHMAENT